MKVNEILEPIPSLDVNALIHKITANYATYPKNSLTPREVVESLTFDVKSFEEAKKLCDELNADVTTTILKFHTKYNKPKK